MSNYKKAKGVNSDPLFELIKSLSKSEKRFIKLYANLQSGDKNYLKLMDVLEKRSSYDENALKTALNNEKFIKHLHVTKNYLYNFILKCLVAYPGDQSVDQKLVTMILQVEALIRKKLNNQALRIIRQGKRIAEEYMKYTLLLEFLRWELRVYNTYPEKAKEACGKGLGVISALESITKYGILSLDIYNVIHRGQSGKDTGVSAELERFMQNPMLRANPSELSWGEADSYYYIWGAYYFIKRNKEAMIKTLREHIALRENAPHLIPENAAGYINILYNLFLAYKVQFKYKEALKVIEKIRNVVNYFPNLKKIPDNVLMRIFICADVSQMALYLKVGEFNKANKMVDDMQKKVVAFGDVLTIASEVEYDFNTAILYFYLNKYRESLKVTEKILGYQDKNVRLDIMRQCYLLQLIIFYEQQKFDLLEYRRRSYIRAMKKISEIPEYEQLVLKCVKRLSKHAGTKEAIGELKSFKKEISPLLPKMEHGRGYQYFDILSWIESKISGKSLEVVLRARLQNN